MACFLSDPFPGGILYRRVKVEPDQSIPGEVIAIFPNQNWGPSAF